ncbi:MAG: helix-turn-helix domain-containing protein [Vampirovibrionales bacterium]|nr:helix-turn-helix domain-containing protein [Vampirovibrionales bacterium]
MTTAFAEALARLTQSGLTRAAIAAALHVDRATLYRWETAPPAGAEDRLSAAVMRIRWQDEIEEICRSLPLDQLGKARDMLRAMQHSR